MSQSREGSRWWCCLAQTKRCFHEGMKRSNKTDEDGLGGCGANGQSRRKRRDTRFWGGHLLVGVMHLDLDTVGRFKSCGIIECLVSTLR